MSLQTESTPEGSEIPLPQCATGFTDQPLPINVLVVGETQQGKSALIKQLSLYAGLRNVDIGIGYGNVACTKYVGRYNIPVVLRAYRLADSDGNTISDMSYSDMCDLGEDEARALPVEEEYPEKHSFTFIDTPGLDDSEGEDPEIMAGIIGKVSEFNHINAVIYVRNVNKPFGTSFKQFFNYIQRSMPSLSQGLIILHSHFSTEKVDQFLENRKNLSELRRNAFSAATNLDLQHFFMDNEPSEYSPFAIAQSMNESYRLLSHLKSQRPLPITGLKLLKTAAMESFDIHVSNAISQLKNTLERQWETEKSHSQILEQNVLASKREVSRLDRKIAETQEAIRELESGSDVILGTKSKVVDYSFLTNFLVNQELKFGREKLEYDSDCPISYVTKTCSGGSQWLSEDLRGTSWRAEISAGWFRSINGSATFYTTSALKNRDNIKALKGRQKDYEEHKFTHEENIARNKSGVAGSENSRAVQLGDDVERAGQLLSTVEKETFDIALYPLLRRFYSHDGRAKPSRDDIRDFVRVYDPEVANLL